MLYCFQDGKQYCNGAFGIVQTQRDVPSGAFLEMAGGVLSTSLSFFMWKLKCVCVAGV